MNDGVFSELSDSHHFPKDLDSSAMVVDLDGDTLTYVVFLMER